MLGGRVFSGNALKLIAAFCMVIDHIGVIFLPQLTVLRIIGRLAFPIFAFMIAEGCRYTKNKARYLLTLFVVGALCQSVLFLYNHSLKMNVLITFSLSVVLIYALQYFKEALFAASPRISQVMGGALIFAAALLAVGACGLCVEMDYGAEGAMLPLFAALLHPPKGAQSMHLHRFDDARLHALLMLPGLLILALADGGIQFYSFLCMPLLLLYSGKRGKWRMKYFFYVFYPAHLLVLQAIAWIIF